MDNEELNDRLYAANTRIDYWRWLDRAFELGETSRGLTSPNPFVGCVIVKDGKLIGEGATQPYGGMHAERVALEQAGLDARGATVFVTLEPCAHQGKTDPCTDYLIKAGVAEVVYAIADPHSIAKGGHNVLERAGIVVHGDLAVERGRYVHEVFFTNVQHNRPFVIWKAAMSIDGFIADAKGTSKWITDINTRERRSQHLRSEVDAIMVGSQTAIDDDPSLTVRIKDWAGKQPLRVVLDRRGRVKSAPLKLLSDGMSETVIIDAETPREALNRLWEKGITSILIEGGSQVAGAFLQEELVDRINVFYGAVLLGDGLPALNTAWDLADAPRLELLGVQMSGNDIVATYYPQFTKR